MKLLYFVFLFLISFTSICQSIDCEEMPYSIYQISDSPEKICLFNNELVEEETDKSYHAKIEMVQIGSIDNFEAIIYFVVGPPQNEIIVTCNNNEIFQFQETKWGCTKTSEKWYFEQIEDEWYEGLKIKIEGINGDFFEGSCD